MSNPSGIACRLDYIRSIPGVLKLIELVCDLLGLILSGAASVVEGGSGHKGFFIFVAVFALIGTLIIFILAVLNIRSMVLRDRWPLIELCWCALMALFYFIASIVIATIARFNGTYGAAAFFGFAAFITYIADAFFQFRALKANSYRQNEQQYGQSPATYPPQPPTYGQQQTGANTQQQTGPYTQQQTGTYGQPYDQKQPATYDQQQYTQQYAQQYTQNASEQRH